MQIDISNLTLNAKSIKLRCIRLDDCNLTYLSWLEDPMVNQYLETKWSEQSLATITEFVSDIILDNNNFLFAIIDKSTDRHIGNIKLGPINWQHGFAELSYFIGDTNSWGKGFATQAINEITTWGFNSLQLHFIKAGFYQSNIASEKVLIKSGFRFSARFENELKINNIREDHIWYGKYNHN